MNEQPFEGATYSTHDMGMTLELAKEGELYMMAQGAGGGYGNVLERDPGLVMKDLEEELISHETAWDIYRVVYNRSTLLVDEEATLRARAEEREARKARGIPYREFVARWVTPEPPQDLPFYGCWHDPKVICAGEGATRTKMQSPGLTRSFLPHPKEVRIAERSPGCGVSAPNHPVRRAATFRMTCATAASGLSDWQSSTHKSSSAFDVMTVGC